MFESVFLAALIAFISIRPVSASPIPFSDQDGTPTVLRVLVILVTLLLLVGLVACAVARVREQRLAHAAVVDKGKGRALVDLPLDQLRVPDTKLPTVPPRVRRANARVERPRAPNGEPIATPIGVALNISRPRRYGSPPPVLVPQPTTYAGRRSPGSYPRSWARRTSASPASAPPSAQTNAVDKGKGKATAVDRLGAHLALTPAPGTQLAGVRRSLNNGLVAPVNASSDSKHAASTSTAPSPSYHADWSSYRPTRAEVMEEHGLCDSDDEEAVGDATPSRTFAFDTLPTIIVTGPGE